MSLWSADESGKIITRIVIEGDLILETPAHFGNGDGDDLTDMPLLVDALDERTPLLTGASIAGALRSCLRAREVGSAKAFPDPREEKDNAALGAERKSMTVGLFGGSRADDEGKPSSLIVDDALGRSVGVEMREGVKINPMSRTAQEDALFDVEVWPAGTIFPLRLELIVREKDDANALKQALVSALEGFSDGSITLGARKRRGYGRVRVQNWRVKTYDLTRVEGLLMWIAGGNEALTTPPVINLKDALGVKELMADQRAEFQILATCSLDGSLLIRSGGGKDDVGPDMIHLRSRQSNGSIEPILSGTSLAGALRSRALKIAQTIGEREKAQALIKELFGKTEQASRVIVGESILLNARTDLVQNRVSIDRFTGGARETALYNEQPAFGSEDTFVQLDIRLVNPVTLEMGLLLLLLKDIWTGDLPLGGESSVGRGRLKGKHATVVFRQNKKPRVWEIHANGDALLITGKKQQLEDCVTQLKKHLTEGAK